MEIFANKGDILASEADILVVGMYEDENIENDFLVRLNEMLRNKLKKMIKAQGFEAKVGQTMLFPAPDAVPAEYVQIVGLGKLGEQTRLEIREAAGSAAQTANRLGLKTMAIEFLGEDHEDFKAKEIGFALSEALLMSEYKFAIYKKPKKQQRLTQVTIVAEDGRDAVKARQAIEKAQLVVNGTNVARDLVNSPAKDVTPETLAEKATEIASNSNSSIRTRIYDREQCEKKKMNAFLAVAQGSKEEPRLIHLIYKPKKKRIKKKIALVGKGITFDSGGLSIKPAAYMETMKCDMAGAATVLGVFSVLAELQPAYEIHGIIAATDNMPSSTAIKPGDIVRAANGKTIEILNTDAEGRLTLADAIHYAGKQKPDYIIDLATLTGACVVALGEEIAAVMTNDDEFGKMLLSSAASAGEKFWALPLEPRYRSLIESDIADVRNTAKSRYGGAVTAGLFLQEFVPKDQTWAHLDIAGPAYAEKPMGSYWQKGGTGFGVRTLLRFLDN